MSMAAPVSPPPLRDGDRLTSDEFLRRWEATPDLKQAELLDGTVYVPSPVSLPHGSFPVHLSGWLAYYSAFTPGCQAAGDATWIMGNRNVPQPDIALRILPEKGGQSRVEGLYAAGAPELIVEIAASSRARDLGPKRHLYQRMQVREYLVVLTDTQQLHWHQLTSEGYRLLDPDPAGIFHSPSFPGLWLDTSALWRNDAAQIFAVLQEGLATPDHAVFVTQLAAR